MPRCNIGSQNILGAQENRESSTMIPEDFLDQLASRFEISREAAQEMLGKQLIEAGLTRARLRKINGPPAGGSLPQ